MKKGITAASVAVMTVIIFILVGTITVTSVSSFQNAKKLTFALEISSIQEEVDKYVSDQQDGTFPITDKIYKANLSEVNSDSIFQFENETQTDNVVTLYEIDLNRLDITDTSYGNKKEDKDVYVVSKETGNVYYLLGVEAGGKTYYTLTEDLIDIKERNNKEDTDEETTSAITFSTDGYYISTTQTGDNIKYLSNVKVTGKNLTVVKYETEIISKANANIYFKNDGNNLVGDRIKIPSSVEYMTLYAKNSKGTYVVAYVNKYGDIVYDEPSKDTPPIPDGFIASIITGEKTVDEGFVIYEGNQKITTYEEARATRNQFVWVPVDYETEEEFEELFDSLSEEPYSQVTESNDTTGEYAEYLAMKESIKKYKGFYIGRYEAGKETTTLDTGEIVETVVSKKGNTTYNNVAAWYDVPWGDSMTSVGTTGAVALARGMYQNNDSIVSTLCYGVQWELMLDYIEAGGYDVFNSSTWGNYPISVSTSGTAILPGSNNTYKARNIYDVAGNVWEWTMEANYFETNGSNSNGRIYFWTRLLRGGSYDWRGITWMNCPPEYETPSPITFLGASWQTRLWKTIF